MKVLITSKIIISSIVYLVWKKIRAQLFKTNDVVS